MGNIVKLQNAGESVTWRIAKAESVPGNFGQQVKLESDGGEILYMPHDSAMRQLERIPLTLDEAVGEVLVISRDPNPKPGAKPYWGIRLGGSGDKAPAPSGKRVESPYQPPSIGKVKGLDDDFANFPDEEYGRSVADPYGDSGPLPPFHKPEQVKQAVPMADSQKVAPQAAEKARVVREYLDLLAFVKAEQPKLSDEAAQAAAATIWITWGQKGLR